MARRRMVRMKEIMETRYIEGGLVGVRSVSFNTWRPREKSRTKTCAQPAACPLMPMNMCKSRGTDYWCILRTAGERAILPRRSADAPKRCAGRGANVASQGLNIQFGVCLTGAFAVKPA